MNKTVTINVGVYNIARSFFLKAKSFIKVSVLAFVLAVGYLTSSAQNSIGIKGGINLTSLEWSLVGNGMEKQVRPGFHFGVVSKVLIFNNAYFAPELLIVQKGDFDNFARFDKTDFYYLELPFLISYSPIKLVEIQAGFNLAAKIRPDLIYKPSVGSVSLGTVVNITKKIFFSSRFNFDLTPTAIIGDSPSDKLSGFSLLTSLGYRINPKT